MAEEEKKKEGVSVKELESYAKKNRFEIFFCILFILASLFTLVFWGPTISIFAVGVGGVLSVLFSKHVDNLAHKVLGAILGKETTFQLIVAILAFIVAIFLAPIVFFLFGLHAGLSMVDHTKGLHKG